MEKQNVSSGSPAVNQSGDFVVIINSLCANIEDGCSSVVFAENLSVYAAIGLAMELHKISVPEAVIYVTHKDCVKICTTSYTLVLSSFKNGKL